MDPHDENPVARDAEPSQTARIRRGLGIAHIGSPPRSQSHQGLVQDAAPMAGSADSYDHPLPVPDPDPDPDQIHEGEWTPPLTGRTLGGIPSPEPSPSAWEIVAKRTHYWHHEDREDLGTGLRSGRDVDTISLDSLQMRNEVDGGAGDRLQTDYDTYKQRLAAQPPLPSKPPADVKVGRTSGPAMLLLFMSLYSTIMSGVWFVVAAVQPRWGTIVSSHGAMTLSTSNLVTAILAKTIEMSFVYVFVSYIGQRLTRRAMVNKEGMTLSEMSMRGWVTQPGSLFVNVRTLKYAGKTSLGGLTLIATIVVICYTTASDTMVAPKLQLSKWKAHQLKSYIKASYANSAYIESNCATPISVAMDETASSMSCFDVQNAGNSWPDILNFVSTWAYTTNASQRMADRPQIESTLHDNVTVLGTWIETQFSDVPESYDRWSRIVNNVSLAMPHPGVYTASVDKSTNHILQPSDLDGIGSYNVTGSVISPAANVLCVNMSPEELQPLVYTAWPDANRTNTGVGDQYKASNSDWYTEVPVLSSDEWLNSTVVDDIFGWGEKYHRRPPVFELYPYDNNFYANDSMPSGASVYFIAKSRLMSNYTVCELRSWPAIQCSTRFDVSGTTGMRMSADCSQDVDYYPQNASLYESNPDAYVHHMNLSDTVADVGDWKYYAQQWVLSLSLSSGLQNGNSSVSRILTECALSIPQLKTSLPSLAEGLAALLANTLVTSALDTPFVHYWGYNTTILDGAGDLVTFPARVRSQEYASWHSEGWQGMFYVILAAAVLLNILCLGYFCYRGLVQDFLEPTRLFAIATSVSSAATGAGRSVRNAGESESMLAKSSPREEKAQLVVPYRLAYREDADHYVFEEAAAAGGGNTVTSSGVELEEGVGKRKRYARLSAKPIF